MLLELPGSEWPNGLLPGSFLSRAKQEQEGFQIGGGLRLGGGRWRARLRVNLALAVAHEVGACRGRGFESGSGAAALHAVRGQG